ncbi:MAG: LLM class flavin-dependent oxidoreductase, partial [Acidimicrobiia bacterium]|nr:LLM class flavin-dependent oxidoreductase [Acidimicrobiia bacterium]
GHYFELNQARNNPKPIQQPHPPICIGGQGPKRTLPLVARYAQHWNYPGRSNSQLAATRDLLDAECAKIGRDPAEIHVSASVWVDAELEPGAVAELAANRFDAGVDEVLLYLPPPHKPAVLEPLAEAMAAL